MCKLWSEAARFPKDERSGLVHEMAKRGVRIGCTRGGEVGEGTSRDRI